MMRIEKSFIDCKNLSLIVTNMNGEIIYINACAKEMLSRKGIDDTNTIGNLDEILKQDSTVDSSKIVIDQVCFAKNMDVEYFEVEFEDKGKQIMFAFFEMHKKVKELMDILNNIDDTVAVINKDLTVEMVNDAYTRHTGIERSLIVKKNLNTLKERGIVLNPLTPEILMNKKTTSKNVKYQNGSLLTLTGRPIFNDYNEIEKVIVTGRNMTKLFQLEKELSRIEKLYKSKLKEFDLLEEVTDNIAYASKTMKGIVMMALRVAKKDSSIFIYGESGVGKEVIAKLIHESSRRKRKPFIAINCASIPCELLESELFGYEEGAFTGARRSGKKGLFEEAEGGTIFLDEIGEMPLSMQSKLLRVIQENKLTRIGGKTQINIDVRYISATNLTREQLNNGNEFRQDLLYRLGVIPIFIPPLRERKDDIIPLVEFFLSQSNEKHGLRIKISKKVINALYAHDWPGNTRELKNIIERLVILSESEMVDFEQYQELFRMNINNKSKENYIPVPDEVIPLKEAFTKLEKHMILRAIKKEQNIVKAANALGIAPSTIYRKMKRGEIEF